MIIFGYILYLFPALYIVFVVGARIHRHGYHYILRLQNHDETVSTTINNLLLYGYYLVNMGYAVYVLSRLKFESSWDAIVLEVLHLHGVICLVLAVLHYMNLLVLYLIRKHINP